jgi:CRP-like cAMP-binding protein
MSTPTLAFVWLKERSALGNLPDTVLETMLPKLQYQDFPANRRLVLENTLPDGLYILGRGHLERYRTNLSGPAWATSLLPGAVLHLTELLLEQPTQETIVALTDCQFWFLPKAELMAIAPILYLRPSEALLAQADTPFACVSKLKMPLAIKTPF